MTVEDREEEYYRARARIFSSPTSPVFGDSSLAPSPRKILGLTMIENELCRNSENDPEMLYVRDGSISGVAIIRDIGKELFDPDYDRSYGRYTRSMPSDQSFSATRQHPSRRANFHICNIAMVLAFLSMA